MWQGEQNLKCPGCSQPIDESWVFDPDEQDVKDAAYTARIRKCVACAKAEFTSENYHKNEKRDKYGIHPVVERTDSG